MKLGWGMGEVVVILLSFVSYLFGLTSTTYTLSLFFLLSGVWTLITGLFFADKRDRTYYSSWGVIVAVLATFAFIPTNYALGLVLIAVIALIILTAYTYRTGVFTAATRSSASQTGETPAAN
jgi:uncharacterized membrane protein HdeD (DUF308 family)